MSRTALLAISFLCAAPAALAASTLDGGRYSWPVVGVKDGDTLAVEIAGLPPALNPVGLRVRGIDTPESGGRAECADERALAAQATAFTRRAITAGTRIEFTAIGWDKYGGRIDAEVWIDDVSLAAQLIGAGLARPYDGGARKGWCGF